MTTLDPLDDLEFTLGRLDGRRVWFASDGTVVPYVGGGDGDDDIDDDDHDDDGADGTDGDDGDDGDDGYAESLAELANLAHEMGLSPAQLKGRLEASKKWERRAKENKAEVNRLRSRGSNGSDDDSGDAEQVREQVRSEERTRFASRSVEMYLDAQVEAGRITDEQADGLLDSIDPTKFIDDDGDVDTDKVKGLLKVIAKPGKGTQDDGTKGRLDSGQGRRQGTQRRGEKQSYAAGRDLWAERTAASS